MSITFLCTSIKICDPQFGPFSKVVKSRQTGESRFATIIVLKTMKFAQYAFQIVDRDTIQALFGIDCNRKFVIHSLCTFVARKSVSKIACVWCVWK